MLVSFFFSTPNLMPHKWGGGAVMIEVFVSFYKHFSFRSPFFFDFFYPFERICARERKHLYSHELFC